MEKFQDISKDELYKTAGGFMTTLPVVWQMKIAIWIAKNWK